MKSYVVALVKLENGYRVWVYGLFPDEAFAILKEKFVGVGNYPLCYSERIIPSISSQWKGCKLVSLPTLFEKFINDHFPEYQKKSVLPYLPYIPKVTKSLTNKRRRNKWVE
ncbi:MAG: hypothetical protein QW687_00095 [Candidatus Hadarchaeales archaeon]